MYLFYLYLKILRYRILDYVYKLMGIVKFKRKIDDVGERIIVGVNFMRKWEGMEWKWRGWFLMGVGNVFFFVLRR